MKKIALLTMVMLAFSGSVTAQKVNEKEKEADKKFNNFAYVDARQIYLDVAKSGYKSENILKKLGDSYYFNNDLKQSLPWYEELSKFQKYMEPDYMFRYAMALKSNERYKEADSIMALYMKRTNTQANLRDINYLDVIELNSNKFEVNPTSINTTESSEYAPSYSGNKIVFSSNRKHDSKKKQTNHQWSNQPFRDLFSVELMKDNVLGSKVEALSESVNSQYHESSTTFTKDGKTMYFSRNNYTNNVFKQSEQGINLIKLYKSQKNDDGTWQMPVELPFNSDNYSVAHPALSADGKKLYFASDMPGTKGQSDIYVVDVNADGTYGIPVNLGDKINTPARETYPYISDKNQLYFASDGHPGLGGLDVFVTEIKTGNTTGEILNLGKPINTPNDDFTFIIDTEDNTGFFASNRNGTDDIFSFKQKGDVVTSCKQYVNGIVSDQDSSKGLKNVTVQLLDEQLQVKQTTTTNDKGFYQFVVPCNTKSVVRVAMGGFQTSEKPYIAHGDYEKQGNVNIPVKKGTQLGVSKAGYGDDLGKILELDPIYFDFDKSNIRPDAEIELQKIVSLLKRYPKIDVEVRSHTDSYGASDYNRALSDRRAKETVRYIVSKGVASSRISGNGYGDTQLVNGCEKGVPCSDADHQLNRRSEFIILNSSDLSDYSINPNPTTPTTTSTPVQTSNFVVNTNTQKVVTSGSETYTFQNNSPAIYTVQLGAFRNPSNGFTELDNVFYHQYSDGIIRYYSGIFNNYEEANVYKLMLTERGYTGVYVLKLKGEERITQK